MSNVCHSADVDKIANAVTELFELLTSCDVSTIIDTALKILAALRNKVLGKGMISALVDVEKTTAILEVLKERIHTKTDSAETKLKVVKIVQLLFSTFLEAVISCTMSQFEDYEEFRCRLSVARQFLDLALSEVKHVTGSIIYTASSDMYKMLSNVLKQLFEDKDHTSVEEIVKIVEKEDEKYRLVKQLMNIETIIEKTEKKLQKIENIIKRN